MVRLRQKWLMVTFLLLPRECRATVWFRENECSEAQFYLLVAVCRMFTYAQFYDTYAKQVWNKVKSAIGLEKNMRESIYEWNEIFKVCKGKSAHSNVRKAFVCSAIHEIWLERNRRRFQNRAKVSLIVASNIVLSMKNYIQETVEGMQYSRELKQILTALRLDIHTNSKEIRYCSWIRQEPGEKKINTDGLVV